MRHFNYSFATVLLVTIWVIGLGVHLAHQRQIDKNAEFILREARSAESAGDRMTAVELYGRYLRYRPDDNDAYAAMAHSLADAAQSANTSGDQVENAYVALEEAIRRQPEDNSIRLRLVKIALLPGFVRLSAAHEHLQHLLASQGKNAKLLALLARVEFLSGRTDAGMEVCRRLTGYDPQTREFDISSAVGPHELEPYELLAHTLREQMQSDQALRVMEHMAQANVNSAQAHLRLGVYLRRFHSDDQSRTYQARSELRAALRLAPDDATVILAQGEVLLSDADIDHAREQLERGLSLDSKNPFFYRHLSALSLFQGRLDDAQRHLEEGLRATGRKAVLLQPLIEIQLQQQDSQAARQTVAALKQTDIGLWSIKMVEAQLALLEGDFLSVTKELEPLRQFDAPKAELSQVDLLLAQAYQRLSEPDRMLSAYDRILETDPDSPTALLGRALALALVGRDDEALRIYSHLQEKSGSKALATTPGAVESYLNLLIEEQLRRPKDDRRWDRVTELLEFVREHSEPGEPQHIAATAEILARRGQLDEARQTLRDAIAKQPQNERLWSTLARLELHHVEGDRQERGENSLKVIQQAKDAIGPSLPVLLLHANLLAQRQTSDPEHALRTLDEEAKELAKADRVALWKKLGDASYRLGATQLARKYWLKVAEAWPADTTVRTKLFDLARGGGDDAAMQEMIGQIKAVAGDHSPLVGYVDAARLVTLIATNQQDQTILSEAEKLVTQVLEARPNWPAALKLRAEVDLLQNNVAGATAYLQRAIDAGERSPAVIRQVVQLLTAVGRTADAKRYLDRLPATERAGLERLAAELELVNGNVDAGLQEAIALVDRSGDPADLLWYGVRSARAGRREEAERALREAVAKAPQLSEAWVALIGHFAATKQMEQAKEALKDAEQTLPKENSAVVLARGHQLIGDHEMASRYYEQAVKAQPESADVRRIAVGFYATTGQRDKAIGQLEELIRISELPTGRPVDLSWARRAMAEVVASSGRYADHIEALKILDAYGEDSQAAIDDLRVRGLLLSRRNDRASREDAIAVFEDLKQRGQIQDSERVLLARLYERQGQHAQAREQLLTLLATEAQAENPALLAELVEMLLRQGDLAEASTWHSRLEKLQPDAVGTLVLRARILAERQETTKALKLLHELVARGQTGLTAAAAGAMLEQWKEFSEAERFFRQHVETELDTPASKLQLAGFLGRRGKTKEALDVIEDAASDKAQAVRFGLDVLQHAGDAVQSHASRIDGWIKEGTEEQPNNLALLLTRTELLHKFREDYDAVETAYRELLDRTDLTEQQRAVVANNMAVLLAVRHKAGIEALKLVDEALQYFGPSSDLLDTRAMAHLAAADAQSAIVDLTAAVADDPASALKQFHLALAQQAAGDLRSAEVSLDRARRLGLNLSALEQKRYDALVSALAEASGR